MKYRHDASEALKRANVELATSNDQRLKYAALELRFAMEALTYDRAFAYKAELPPEEYDTWQPRKLMALLLEIDPNADKDSSIAVGMEERPGVPSKVMRALGTERVFNLAHLKKHYGAIGSYLHMPSIKQATSCGGVDYLKLRERCKEVAMYIDEVLASKVWNATLGRFAQIKCEECSATIRKRVPHGVARLSAKCFGCATTYTVTDAGSGQLTWQIDVTDVSCANPDCGHVIHILDREFKPGSTWICPSCKGRNTIALGISFRADLPTPSVTKSS